MDSRPHWVSIIISSGEHSDQKLSSLEVKAEAEAVYESVLDSGLCSPENVHYAKDLGSVTFKEVNNMIQKAVESLQRDSKLLVFYTGHGYCTDTGHTWITPEDAVDWNSCILLEDEIRQQVVSWQDAMREHPHGQRTSAASTEAFLAQYEGDRRCLTLTRRFRAGSRVVFITRSKQIQVSVH